MVEMQNGVATLEDSSMISYKTDHRSVKVLSIILHRAYPYELKLCILKKLHVNKNI